MNKSSLKRMEPQPAELAVPRRKETALNPHLLTPLDIQPSFSALSRAPDA